MTIDLPEECLRGFSSCQPLAQIASDDRRSFICCGHNDESTRQEPQDRFRVCWHNDVIDEMSDWDETDMLDTVSVLSQALSADVHMSGQES